MFLGSWHVSVDYTLTHSMHFMGELLIFCSTSSRRYNQSCLTTKHSFLIPTETMISILEALWSILCGFASSNRNALRMFSRREYQQTWRGSSHIGVEMPSLNIYRVPHLGRYAAAKHLVLVKSRSSRAVHTNLKAGDEALAWSMWVPTWHNAYNV